MADGREDWPGGSDEQPDFGPPGPADDGGVRPSVPPPPPSMGTPMPDQPSAPDWNTGFAAGTPQKDNKSTLALVLGIIAIPCSVFCALFAVPLGIAAIILGAQGRKRAKSVGLPSGVATAGLVLGVVSLVLVVAWLLFVVILGASADTNAA